MSRLWPLAAQISATVIGRRMPRPSCPFSVRLRNTASTERLPSWVVNSSNASSACSDSASFMAPMAS